MSIKAPSLPSSFDVLAAQLRLLRRRHTGLRWLIGLVLAQVATLAFFGIVFGITVSIGPDDAHFGFSQVDEIAQELEVELGRGVWALVFAFAVACVWGFFWPFSVWGGEPPRRRDHHWAMPVAHGRHDLLRAAAGALVLLVVIAIFYLGAVFATLLAGRLGELAVLGPWHWLSLVLGPLIPYLWSTLCTLRAEHPAAWSWSVIGIGVLFATLATYLRWTAPIAIVTGRFGLGPAISGPVANLFGAPFSAGPTWLLAWGLWCLPMLIACRLLVGIRR